MRILHGALALAFAIGGVIGLRSLRGDGVHSVATAPIGHLVFGGLTAGALLFLVGVAGWRGGLACAARSGGWVLMAAALATPSTLTLALPFVTPLIAALRTFPVGGDAARPRRLRSRREPVDAG